MRARSHTPPYLLRLVQDTAQALARVDPFDRAMTLAAQAFTSLFPLVIIAAATLGEGSESLGDRISDSLSLPADTRSVLETALGHQASSESAAFGVVSVLVVLLSATSFARALARMYARVWRVPPSGWTGGWRWVAVIVGVALCTLIVKAADRAARGELPATVGAVVLTLVVYTVLWSWVPWLLLVRRVSYTALLPGGVLSGVGCVGTLLASHVYMPRALESAAREFGAFGVAFTYIGWLFVVAFVLIVATVLGWVLQEAGGPRPSGSSAPLTET